MTGQPFDDIRALLDSLPEAAFVPTDPSLGRLGEISAMVRGWRGGAGINRPIAALYAGSSGSDPEGVRARLEAIAAGVAPVAAATQSMGAGLEAFDLAIDRPVGPAGMSERECAATMAFGMEALAKQPDLLVLAVLSDDGRAGERVVAALKAGADPLQALLGGGRPMAAVAGAIVAARTQKVPVLLDGLQVCAAAAVLKAIRPAALDHCLAAHDGGGKGHAALLQHLGLEPLLQLGAISEDGVGAVAAVTLVRTAAAL